MISDSVFMCFFLLAVSESFSDAQQNTNLLANKFAPQVNLTKCSGSTICNDVFNYPEKHVMKAFRVNATKYSRFIGEDKIDVNVTIRFADLDKTLCEATKQLEEPKAGKNNDDEWLFIVNHGDYKQAVETVVCSNLNEPCKMSENFPVRTECRQKYILRKMLALDPKDGQLKEETIKLPSCCTCRYFEIKSK